MTALQAAGAAAELVPHEARYDIALESLQIEGFPIEAGGKMAVRLTRDCQKWELLQEMRFSIGLEGATPIELHFQVRILEGLDGKRMEFSGWQEKDGRDRVKLRGRARMNADGYGGAAKFQHPEETDWTLPTPTRLLLAARRDLLTALSSGRTDAQSIAFEVQGVSEVTRVSPGKGLSASALKTKGAPLLKEKSWLVDRAVYMEEIARNDPFMLETQQIHANGVVSRFRQDYHSMVLAGELVALEELPEPDC
jgi:hypothetical protein